MKVDFSVRQQKGEIDRMFGMLPKDRPIRAVEIGTKAGHWAVRFLIAVPRGELWCIDPWRVDQGDNLPPGVGATEESFMKWLVNMRPWLGKRVWPMRCKSWETLASYIIPGDIDLLWIDGDHRYEAVIEDLRVWVPRVRQGGLIAGHDWTGGWQEQIRKAVNDWKQEDKPYRRPKKIHTGFLVPSIWECFWFWKDWEGKP